MKDTLHSDFNNFVFSRLAHCSEYESTAYLQVLLDAIRIMASLSDW